MHQVVSSAHLKNRLSCCSAKWWLS